MPNLTIRNMDPDILARFNRAAGARQMTQREYLAALVELHEYMIGLPWDAEPTRSAELCSLVMRSSSLHAVLA